MTIIYEQREKHVIKNTSTSSSRWVFTDTFNDFGNDCIQVHGGVDLDSILLLLCYNSVNGGLWGSTPNFRRFPTIHCILHSGRSSNSIVISCGDRNELPKKEREQNIEKKGESGFSIVKSRSLSPEPFFHVDVQGLDGVSPVSTSR